MAEQRKKLRLGELLVQQGLITPDQLRIALTEQKHNNMPLGRLLVRLGFVTEAVIRDILARTARPGEHRPVAGAWSTPRRSSWCPQDFARRHRLLPIAYDAEQNAADRRDHRTVQRGRAGPVARHARAATSRSRPLLAGEAQLDELHRAVLRPRALGRRHPAARSRPARSTTSSLAAERRRVHASRWCGWSTRCSPTRSSAAPPTSTSSRSTRFLRIRYRIDGVLRPDPQPAQELLAGDRGAPQGDERHEHRRDARAAGRAHLAQRSTAGRSISASPRSPRSTARTSCCASSTARSRIVPPRQTGPARTTQLTMLKLHDGAPRGHHPRDRPDRQRQDHDALLDAQPQSTTSRVNIMTLEDPVEYPMTLIRQTSVNEAAKLDFANGIRSMMRQDPDIILVGEIRDEETAEMAFRAAMTGHQVYTTLHTNSALGAIPAPARHRHRCPTSWPATSSASSRSAWCAGCARTARRPTRPTPEERQLLGVDGRRAGSRSTARWAASSATTRATGAASRSWRCCSMDAEIDELVARRATARETARRGASPRASARSPRTASRACSRASPAWRRWRAWST